MKVRGRVDSVFSERLQSALNYATEWCKDANLSINPKKTIDVPFTRRRKLSSVGSIREGLTIEYRKEIKYLGVLLESKLLWNSQIKRAKEIAMNALKACRAVVSQR
jgi:hypothetical protein